MNLAAFAAPAMVYTDADLDLMARTLLGEAANQGSEGMAAVGWSARNRVADPRWPGTLSGVLTPGAYSAWNEDGTGNELVRSGPTPALLRARAIAQGVLDGAIEDPTDGATHYYSPSGMDAYVAAGHQSNRVPTWYDEEAARGAPRQIGDHVFLGRAGGAAGGDAQTGGDMALSNQYGADVAMGDATTPVLAGGLAPKDTRGGFRRAYDWMGNEGLFPGLMTGLGLLAGGDRALPMLSPYAGAYGETEASRKMQEALGSMDGVDPRTATLAKMALDAGQPAAAMDIIAAAAKSTAPSPADQRWGMLTPEQKRQSALVDAGLAAKPSTEGGADDERRRKARFEAMAKIVSAVEAAPEGRKDTAWRQARTAVGALGVDTSSVPEKYDPEAYGVMRDMFLDEVDGATPQSPVGKLRRDLERGRITPEDFQRGTGLIPDGYQKTATGDLEPIPGGPADPKVKAAQRGRGIGLRVGADGEMVFTQGDVDPDALSVSRGTKTKTEQSLLDDLQMLPRLAQIRKVLEDPQAQKLFSTVSDWEYGFKGLLEREWPGSLSEEDRRYLDLLAEADSTMGQTFDLYKVAITGAAAGVREMEDLRTSLFDRKSTTYSQFIRKFGVYEDTVNRNIQIAKAVLRKGLGRAEMLARIDQAANTGLSLDDIANSRFIELKQENPSADNDAILDMMEQEGFK